MRLPSPIAWLKERSSPHHPATAIRHPFNLAWPWTLLYGLIAVLISVLLTQVTTLILLRSIDSTLGIPKDAGYRLTWSSILGQESAGDTKAHDTFCTMDPPYHLKNLDEKLTEHANQPRELLQVVCGSLRSYREAAAKADPPSEALPMIGPMPEKVVKNVRVGEIGECNAPLPLPIGEAKKEWRYDLGWYQTKCLFRRVRGVMPREGVLGIVLMQDVAASGLQGNVYAYRWPRTMDSWKDPNKVGWESPGPDDEEKVKALTTLAQGLSRLDKLLLPSIRAIEKEVWVQRFFLRAFNNPFQFVILTLGLWGLLLYLEMAWSTRRFGRNGPEALALDVLQMAPMGGVAAGPLGVTRDKLAPYGSELRNAADELTLQAQFNGKAVADTLAEWVPTLGFIGTVVGMIGAMDAVSGVVGADAGPEMFSAMSEVTGQLSVAFYTTFIALLVGLGLALLRRWALACELRSSIEAIRIVRSPS